MFHRFNNTPTPHRVYPAHTVLRTTHRAFYRQLIWRTATATLPVGSARYSTAMSMHGAGSGIFGTRDDFLRAVSERQTPARESPVQVQILSWRLSLSRGFPYPSTPAIYIVASNPSLRPMTFESVPVPPSGRASSWLCAANSGATIYLPFATRLFPATWRV